jgi:hypothetical protein
VRGVFNGLNVELQLLIEKLISDLIVYFNEFYLSKINFILILKAINMYTYV